MVEESLTAQDIVWMGFVVVVLLLIVVPDLIGRRRHYRPLRKTGDRLDP